MGVINHNCVIAVFNDPNDLKCIGQWLRSLTTHEAGMFICSDVMTNGYQSVIMIPDGSKEGWTESNNCNELRKKFIEEIKKYNVEYIEVSFGDYGSKIEQTNCRGDL